VDKPKVVVAMSGGVDSSVAAALLVEQGYQVIGMMMRLWNEPGSQLSNRCCTPDSMAQARRVASKLDIPFYAVNAQTEFHHSVVKTFITGYSHGLTPNPCLVCNREVRWEFLLSRAIAIGAQFMATGHYARLRDGANDQRELLRAVDAQKDQSYVLHVLDQGKLKHALFPLGEYTKPEVRELARNFDLPVADRADSQDLCFIGTGDYRAFLRRNAPNIESPGPILNSVGDKIGEHTGLAFYTIGQRKGLGISASQPLYVKAKDIERNALVVGEKNELGASELTVNQVNWISGEPLQEPFRAHVKIRYKSDDHPGLVTPLGNGKVHISFEHPLRDITPGQAAVIYNGQICLGGGIIKV